METTRDIEVRTLLQHWADRLDRQLASLRHELDVLEPCELVRRRNDLTLLSRLESERRDVEMAFSRIDMGAPCDCLDCGRPLTETCIRECERGPICAHHSLIVH